MVCMAVMYRYFSATEGNVKISVRPFRVQFQMFTSPACSTRSSD
jgi:hypothetical protein